MATVMRSITMTAARAELLLAASKYMRDVVVEVPTAAIGDAGLSIRPITTTVDGFGFQAAGTHRFLLAPGSELWVLSSAGRRISYVATDLASPATARRAVVAG